MSAVCDHTVLARERLPIKYMKKLMGAKVFDNPKDHEELLRLFRYIAEDDDEAIVLDFFGGSASTAEAVLQLNAEDHTNRRFVLVQ
jgi:adenine-specific DNA-methyltransferase